MYVAPSSVVKILHNVPLDTTYEHTIYFATKAAQTSYFQGLAKYTFSNVSYQRVRRGWMRVEKNAENLYDCNYLMFQNTAFGNKWFYAYIRSVEYVNNEVSEIQFEIDVMQTWMFDYTLQKCFVVREHSATDNIGDNLMPEPVNIGQYVTGDFHIQSVDQFGDWCLVMVCCADPNTSGILPPDGAFVGGVYQAADYLIWNVEEDDTQDIIDDIKDVMNHLSFFNNMDTVVAFYMCPRDLIAYTGDYHASKASSLVGNFNMPVAMSSPTLGSYGTPKNKKLLTYPYSYLYATNNQGEQIEFKYEFFHKINDRISFTVYTDESIDPTICYMPVGYLQNDPTEWQENFDYSLQVRGFPKCTIATNDLVAKLAQGGMAITLAALTHGVSLGMGVPGGSATALSMAPNWLNSTAMTASQQPYTGNQMIPYPNRYVSAQTTETEPVNSIAIKTTPTDAAVVGALASAVWRAHPYVKIGQGNINYATDTLGVTFKQTFIAPEYAEAIDDFFTMYGYQTNKIKVPNIAARPHWNYVRTNNCTITGSIPADDAKRICEIYDRGVTFWKNGSEVGHYELDNSPIVSSPSIDNSSGNSEQVESIPNEGGEVIEQN